MDDKTPQLKPYYQLEEFPYLKVFQDNWEVIRDECLHARKVLPWVEWSDKNYYTGDWLLLPMFLQDGSWSATAASICPVTMRLLADLPGRCLAGFSMLRPITRVLEHGDGYVPEDPFGYRFHLPLVIPPTGCSLTVAGETREWTEGQLMIFDERLRHSAQNLSTQDRFVLLVDVYPPDQKEISHAP